MYSSNTESTLDSYAKNKLLAVLTGLLYDAVSENHHTQLEIHSQLSEDLEWLKIIEMGYKINSYEVEAPEIGINTIDDFNYLSNKYSK